jgi:hypothetical protein
MLRTITYVAALCGFVVTTAVAFEKTPQKMAGDTCGAATAEVSALPFMDSGNTSAATDDYRAGLACTPVPVGPDTMAPDVVYRLRTDVTCNINVAALPTGPWDLSLYAGTDCGNFSGSCAGYSNSFGIGGAESLSFVALGGVDYFVVVDGANTTQHGTYDFLVNSSDLCQLTPVTLQSFSVN